MKSRAEVWRIDLFIWVVCSVFILACATDRAVRKQQEEASRRVGEAYMAQGNYTFALRELLKAEQLHGKDPYLHLDLDWFTWRKKNLIWPSIISKKR